VTKKLQNLPDEEEKDEIENDNLFFVEITKRALANSKRGQNSYMLGI